MTTQELYNKVLKEEVSQESFLYTVRRDPRFSSFINSTNSFEDTVKALKNHQMIFGLHEAKEDESFDLMGSIRQLNEAAKQKKDIDHVNDYEFQKGWRIEYNAQKGEKDVEKAKAKALKNLNKDDIYYTRMIAGVKKPTKRTDLPIEVNKSRSNVVDKPNGTKPAKGVKKDKATPTGSKEKASSKNAGVKVMKGGQGGDMKAKQLKEGDKKKVAEGSEPKITGVAISSIRKDYGGGYMISGNVNGEKRVQKISTEDARKGFKLRPDEFKQLVQKYLVDEFDEKVDTFLKGKADVRDQIAKADTSLNEFVDESAFDKFILKVKKPDYEGTIKRDQKGWMLYDKTGSAEESGPFNSLESLMSYYDIEKSHLSGEYAKNLKESIFSSPDKALKEKQVTFHVESGQDPDKKMEISKVIKSAKKEKGHLVITFKDGGHLMMTKTKTGVRSIYIADAGKPTDHDKVIDLDKTLQLFVDKIFPKDEEEKEKPAEKPPVKKEKMPVAAEETLKEAIRNIIKKKLNEGDLDSRSFEYYAIRGEKIISGFSTRIDGLEFLRDHPNKGLRIISRNELHVQGLDPQIDANWKHIPGVNDYEFKQVKKRIAEAEDTRKKPIDPNKILKPTLRDYVEEASHSPNHVSIELKIPQEFFSGVVNFKKEVPESDIKKALELVLKNTTIKGSGHSFSKGQDEEGDQTLALFGNFFGGWRYELDTHDTQFNWDRDLWDDDDESDEPVAIAITFKKDSGGKHPPLNLNESQLSVIANSILGKLYKYKDKTAEAEGYHVTRLFIPENLLKVNTLKELMYGVLKLSNIDYSKATYRSVHAGEEIPEDIKSIDTTVSKRPKDESYFATIYGNTNGIRYDMLFFGKTKRGYHLELKIEEPKEKITKRLAGKVKNDPDRFNEQS